MKLKGSAAAIGIFDGVHAGHKKIIRAAVNEAKRLGLKSAVVTFDPHPLKVVHPSKISPPTLISLEHRIALFKGMGVDRVIVLNFTRTMGDMKPHEFVERFLVRRLKVKEVVVGHDFRFGSRRRGDARLLRFLGGIYGFRVLTVEALRVGGSIVSSSLIRSSVKKGDLRRSAKFLGRPVSIFGTVAHGAKIGRVLGYPTANIDPHHEVIPPSGVYAVKVRYGGRIYGGVLNIGFKPTIKKKKGKRPACLSETSLPAGRKKEKDPSIEVHIFNFRRKIYRKDLEVIFIKKLRDEKKFKRSEDLVRQIERDSAETRMMLKGIS